MNSMPQDTSDMSPEEIREAQKENCVFCKIIDGEIPSKQVYEDDTILAILDINPAAEGHVLVMPKEHYPILPMVPDDTFSHMFTQAKELAGAVKEGAPATGTSIFVANGAAAGQQSPHFLFHIIPREKQDQLLLLENKDIDQSDLLEPLQQNLGAAMKRQLAEQGKLPEGMEEQSRDQLVQVLDENPELRQAIINDPDEFARIAESNPQLKQLFSGVDIHALSEKLREGSEHAETGAAPAAQQAASPKPSASGTQGTEEQTQRGDQDVIQLLKDNPELRKAIRDDPDAVEQQIAENPSLQELFDGVDIHELSKKLQAYEDDGEKEKTETYESEGLDDQIEDADLDKVQDMFT